MRKSIRNGLRVEPIPPGKILGRGKANLLLQFLNAFCNAELRNGTITITEQKILLDPTQGSGGGGSTGKGGGISFMGEWSSDSTPNKDEIWTYPVGSAAGTYIALQSVAAGIAPDTGAPYWAVFPAPPPGVWA